MRKDLDRRTFLKTAAIAAAAATLGALNTGSSSAEKTPKINPLKNKLPLISPEAQESLPQQGEIIAWPDSKVPSHKYFGVVEGQGLNSNASPGTVEDLKDVKNLLRVTRADGTTRAGGLTTYVEPDETPLINSFGPENISISDLNSLIKASYNIGNTLDPRQRFQAQALLAREVVYLHEGGLSKKLLPPSEKMQVELLDEGGRLDSRVEGNTILVATPHDVVLVDISNRLPYAIGTDNFKMGLLETASFHLAGRSAHDEGIGAETIVPERIACTVPTEPKEVLANNYGARDEVRDLEKTVMPNFTQKFLAESIRFQNEHKQPIGENQIVEWIKANYPANADEAVAAYQASAKLHC